MSKDIVALYRRWRKPIRQWLSHRSTIPTADLDDIAQEVFLRLLRYSNTEMVSNPQGYLFSIASNVANEFQNRACRRQPHDNKWIDDLLEDDDHLPETEAERASEDRHVSEAVNELPTRMGVVVLMHINDGKTYKQIANELGLSYRIVLRDMTRGYAKLREKLDER